jgi:L-rhamnose isomerase
VLGIWAQFTSIGQETDDVELAALYGQLVESWLEGSDKAAAGVAVHTSASKVPRRCFTKFGERFARFTDPNQLRGLVTAVDDFAVFAQRVRDIVWTGL